MTSIPEIFGCSVFNETVMKNKLPKNVYKNLRRTMEKGEPLDTETADVVANAIKDWAIEHGATHYTSFSLRSLNDLFIASGRFKSDGTANAP